MKATTKVNTQLGSINKPFLLCLSVVLSNFFTAHTKRSKHACFAPKDAFVVATGIGLKDPQLGWVVGYWRY